jgi:L-fuconolactonase
LPLRDPAQTSRVLERYLEQPVLRGVRHLIIFEPDPDWLVRRSVLESLALVAQCGYTFDAAAALPRHLEHVARVAERLPDLRIVIDHLGKPPVAARGWEPWAGLFARAAAYPNVWAKLSGLNNIADGTRWTACEFEPYVEHALATFGPERLMFGSNWPVLTLADDYAGVWASVNALVAQLDVAARAAIFGETAIRVYRLDAARLAAGAQCARGGGHGGIVR